MEMWSETKIILAGGGEASDSLLIDQIFSGWLGSTGKLLYLPIALRGMRPFPECLEWITTTLSPLGVSSITMWTDLSEHEAGELDQYEGIYIGGGNTFSLLAQLQESGFKNSLKEYALKGKPVYGGSAGAIVLGHDIHNARHFDINEAGFKELEGLNLAEGFTIWPHYNIRDDEKIVAFVQMNHQPVLAIPERSGIVFENGGFRAVGFEPVYIFDEAGKKRQMPVL
jgi:dipeptidase E